jgi:Na+/proline symporter
MAGVLFIGTYLGKYVKSGSDLFIAGKSLPFWAIGMSIVVSDIGATDFVATAGGGYTYGLTQANYDWLGSMPAMILAAFIFIPFYWRAGAFTIPEFLGKRYNAGVQVIEAAIWLVFLSIMLALMLWVTAILMREVLGWDTSAAIWITATIVGIYTVSGGLTAVVMTDVMQTVVMFIGGAALVILSVIQAGGFSGIQETILAYGDVFQRHFSLMLEHDTRTAFPWAGVVLGLGIVLSTGYMAGNQAVVQRALGARSEWDAKAAMLFAAFLKLLIPLLVVLPGLAALTLNPTLEKEAFDVPREVQASVRASLDAGIIPGSLATEFANEDQRLSHRSIAKVVIPGEQWSVEDVEIRYTVRLGEGKEGLLSVYHGVDNDKEKQAFGLSRDLPATLDQGIVSDDLKKAFASNERALADGLKIEVEHPGEVWVLRSKDTSYTVALELNVYHPDGEAAVPWIIAQVLPPGLKGLMFAAFFAALMSSVDSYLNSCSTIFVQDIYGTIAKRTGHVPTPRFALNLGRCVTVVLILGGAIFAPEIERVQGLYIFIQTLLSYFQGPTLTILLLGILWSRTTGWGALAGLVTGVGLSALMFEYKGVLFMWNEPNLFVAWWTFLASMIVTVVVSLLTPPEKPEKLRGMVWGYVMQDAQAQAALRERTAS